MSEYIQISPADNVAVALKALPEGYVLRVAGRGIPAAETIPSGHKVALKDFSAGETVVKYGFPIGRTTCPVKAGCLLSEKNMTTGLSGLDTYSYSPKFVGQEFGCENRTFPGYRRSGGGAGVRNEIWIIPTVGCVNGIAVRLAEMLRRETGLEGIDDIVAYTHNYGCSQLGDDHENTRRILRCMVRHPNAGGVLVLGLGCENNQPDAFMESLGDYDRQRVKCMVCQQAEDELGEGMKLLRELYSLAREDRRTPVPLSELRIGLKCGGSDGLSGITANPLLGMFSDYMAAQGAATVLTEVPEMFGAETILMERCRNREVFDRLVGMINGFKRYFLDSGQPVYENPSPGNKAGGISTLEEKSLGCTQKAGTSMVMDVLGYGECLRESGLNLLCAPGNDLVASTALAAAGCQIVLFTTGRGTPFGTFVPTVKISTNSALYGKKRSWIDFDAGSIAQGEPMREVCRSLIDFVTGIAGGSRTLNEENGYRGIAIWKRGVTL